MTTRPRSWRAEARRPMCTEGSQECVRATYFQKTSGKLPQRIKNYFAAVYWDFLRGLRF